MIAIDSLHDISHSTHSHQRICSLILGMVAVLFVGLFMFVELRRFALLGAEAFDLGIFQQGVWLLSRGETPFVTVRGWHLFADHFSPILFVFVPFYRLWEHPFWLLLGQTIALAVGVIPLYRLALRHTQSSWSATLIAVSYLLHPASFTMLFFDFHPILLSIPFVLLAMDAADEGRPVPFVIASLGALLCREDVAVSIASLSLYALLVRCRWWGGAMLIISIGWLWGAMQAMAWLSGAERTVYLSLYSRWGETPQQIVMGILRQPVDALKALVLCEGHFTQPGAYPMLLLAPFAFLPLFAGSFVLFALPSYVVLALSDWRAMRELGFQHTALIVPWLAAASAISWGRLLRWSSELSLQEQRQWQKLLAVTWLICLFVAVWRYAPHTFQHFHTDVMPSEQAKAVKALLQKFIPSDASVSAPSALVPVLAHRRQVYLFPNPFQQAGWGKSVKALQQLDGREWVQALSPTVLHQRMRNEPVDYIVLKGWTNTWPLKPDDYKATVIGVLTCRDYGVVAVVDDLVILRCKADFEAGLLRLGVSPSLLREMPLEEAVQAAWVQRKGKVSWQTFGIGRFGGGH